MAWIAARRGRAGPGVAWRGEAWHGESPERYRDTNFNESYMISRNTRQLDDVREACLVGRSTETPTEWALRNFIFDEPNNHGPWKIAGNEYVRDIVDDFARKDRNDFAVVAGSQTKKTGSLMAGLAWRVVNDPCGVLWAMPNEKLAKRFSRQRWQKALRATEATARLIPRGNARHSFSTLEQTIGGAVINFVGSNSAANLASSPCSLVICDEIDKFNEGGSKESDAGNLADQRTKDQVDPQRWRTSTPTLADGLIWQEYLKGSQHRYHIPCPFCRGPVVLAWAPRFTVLPILGCEAWIRWDKAAKRSGGEWDLDRVRLTAHAECPHCRAPIGNEHKTAMVRDGIWKPTNQHAPSTYISRHLSSLYATSPETTFGVLAVKFLQAKRSLLGLQGFINGDLAEPMEAQGSLSDRVELITPKLETAEHARILTIDCQAKSPFFWWVCREWGPGVSRGVECGSADTWDELDAIQKRLGVRNEGVAIDSGFGARSDAEVYASCVLRSEIFPQPQGLPVALGWMPLKGLPGRRMFKDTTSGLSRPYYLRDIDPFEGTSDAGKLRVGLVLFSADTAKDILQALRHRSSGLCTWSVSDAMNNETYWRHMDAEVKQAVRSKSTGRVTYSYQLRSSRWPNHLGDCEVQQVVAASYLGLLDIQPALKHENPT